MSWTHYRKQSLGFDHSKNKFKILPPNQMSKADGTPEIFALSPEGMGWFRQLLTFITLIPLWNLYETTLCNPSSKGHLLCARHSAGPSGGEKGEGPGPCLQGAASLVVKASSNPSGLIQQDVCDCHRAASHSIRGKSTEGDFGLKEAEPGQASAGSMSANEDGYPVAGLYSFIVYPSFIQQTCPCPLSEGVFCFVFFIFILVNLPSWTSGLGEFVFKVPPPLFILELNKHIWLCPDCVSSVYVCISS